MKKITRAQLHKKWANNRLFLWLLIIFVSGFAFTLVWTKLMILEAMRQNVVQEVGLKVTDEKNNSGIRTAARETEFLTLNSAQKSFDELNFLISPNGHSIAYTFNNAKFGKKTLSLNGQAGASYDDITFMKFSSNGQRFAYGAKVAAKSLVIIDGREGKLYDWIFEPKFFTPDNQYFVYKARDDRGDMLVFNNWESKPYDRIYGVTVNNSKTELVYYARQGDQIWQGIVDLSRPLESDLNLKNISSE